LHRTTSFDDRYQNNDQLIAFLEQWFQALKSNDLRRANEPQPVMRFSRLLAGDRILRHEVRAALARLAFFDIRTDRRS